MICKSPIYTGLIFVFVGLLTSCGGGSSGSKQDIGFFSLQFVEQHDFNPEINHGEIDKFKLNLSGDTFEPIVSYYPFESSRAEFDGIEAGSTIGLQIEAINYNGYVVRRGYSDLVNIQAGVTTPVDVEIFNVPIFANVKNGKTVKSNRFIPKIFAQGDLNFEIIDFFQGVERTLQDQIDGNSSFSVSQDDLGSVRPIYIEPLEVGSHTLVVRDTDTDESTTIDVQVIESRNRPVLTTTSSQFFNSFVSGQSQQNLGQYYAQAIEDEEF